MMSAAMVSVNTKAISLNGTVIFQARRAVFIIHALCTSVLPYVAHQGLRAVCVVLAGGPGVPGGLLLAHHLVHFSVPPDHQGGGDAN